MQSILLIRLTSLGDVILASGLVRQLKGAFPDAAIDVAVDSRFADVWSHNPRVRSVYAIDRQVRTNSELSAVAAQAPYDLVVDLQKNRRSKQIIASLQLPAASQVVCINKHRWEKLALVWLKRRPRVVTPITKRYWNTVRDLRVMYDEAGPEVWSADDASGVHPIAKCIGVAPGARHATKRWTTQGYAELVRHLVADNQENVILLGGPDDVTICDEIESLANVPVMRADGARNLAQTLAALDRCRLVVSNDSALMHLARARRIPVVAIFGSTVQELGFAPSGADVRIVERDGLPCRPCSHIGRDRCPKGHFRCMNEITSGEVAAAVDSLLSMAP
ncbi:MAG: glycosyltransferase family 9 protein [Candidatus Kapabacteria bacterium]|nr:glycosyltransferase family 9 protein [Candidatus Kapabacteria bacterium]